jgi:hypothetical protein
MKFPNPIGQCSSSSLQGNLFPCLIVSTEDFRELPFNGFPPAVDGLITVYGLLRSDNGNEPLWSRWHKIASEQFYCRHPSNRDRLTGRRFSVFLQRHTSRTTVQTTAVPASISVCKMQTVNRQQLKLSAICRRRYGQLP